MRSSRQVSGQWGEGGRDIAHTLFKTGFWNCHCFVIPVGDIINWLLIQIIFSFLLTNRTPGDNLFVEANYNHTSPLFWLPLLSPMARGPSLEIRGKNLIGEFLGKYLFS